MKVIPLSLFPLCTFRPSICTHSYQAVVDGYQGHERKRDRGDPERDGDTEPHDKGFVQMEDGLLEKK